MAVSDATFGKLALPSLGEVVGYVPAAGDGNTLAS
jgi:hypothetical protein